jgi:MFS family permease
MLAVMLIAWGAVATCMAFVKDEAGFYALRLLLGACESGAIPVQWAHIMAFFPKTRWARTAWGGHGRRFTGAPRLAPGACAQGGSSRSASRAAPAPPAPAPTGIAR